MDHSKLIGRKIADKYAIEAHLGDGGMGAVYKARQVDLDKLVAVKILHAECAAEPAFVTRFKREAKMASRIDHPNSMQVIDFGQEPDGILYIVMEYLNGKSLFKIFQEESPLHPLRITNLFRQALAALAAAHDMGIVHRDLKPDNVLVMQRTGDEGDAGEHVKVCDFGIAKFAASNQSSSAEKLTAVGTIIGTPDYLSPEQARAGDIDARSDLYSLGVMLFEALTGRTPFSSDTPLGVVLQHLDAEPPRPSSLVPDVDPKLEAICMRCLKKKPDERFASARAMRAAFASESDRPSFLPPGYFHQSIPPAPKVPAFGERQSHSPRTPGRSAPQMTPPPVSSTAPQQEPLLLTKRQPSEPRPRLRLSEVTAAPERSSTPGILVALLMVLATGAVGAWMYKGRAATPPAAASTAPPPVAATAAPAETTPPPTATAPPVVPVASAPPVASVASLAPFDEAPDAGPGELGHGKLTLTKARVPLGAKVAAGAKPEPAPSASAAPVAPAAAAPKGNLSVGQVKASGRPIGEVAAALPGVAIADCYRDALKFGLFSGKATLHFEYSKGDTRPSFRADGPLSKIAFCVETATRATGGQGPDGSADIDLAFAPQ